jgi:ribosomal protein L11 methylase PrmA
MRIKREFIKKMKRENFFSFLNYDFNIFLKRIYYKNEDAYIELIKQENFNILKFIAVMDNEEAIEMSMKQLHAYFKKYKHKIKSIKNLKFEEIYITENYMNEIKSKYTVFSNSEVLYIAMLNKISESIKIKGE